VESPGQTGLGEVVAPAGQSSLEAGRAVPEQPATRRPLYSRPAERPIRVTEQDNYGTTSTSLTSCSAQK